jgi:hypothetical protein
MHMAHLGSHSMAPCGEQFGDTCRIETSLGQTKGCSKTSTSSTAAKRVSRRIRGHGSRVHETYTTMASYSCSMRGYLPLSQDYESIHKLRYPLRRTIPKRISHTFTV